MIHGTISFLSLGGFALLLLAMTRHQQDWLGRKLPPPMSHSLRRSGFLLLGLALFVAGAGLGWGYGVVTWCGWLTITAALVVTANTNRERILRRVRP
ncbi:DUF3325 domain-containing protein (plasmid) [Sphingobium sp. V4]|uniref:DUF3325 domain-containing protein n=1 Tax=Sphingobium sp. V4 TaxID=3038927 RepID=UPI002557DCFE|nr:DUF3325 domain-containing protein [Sphingobium sp. V4]WIW90224.1 DUF3325 domain-containing protein [Sphingobium sp. V4]